MEYFRNWIGHRPIILECESSKSGMSLSVYDRDRRVMRVNGCGFSRIGTAIGDILQTAWQAELAAADLAGCHGVRHIGPRVILDGAAGVMAMTEVARRIRLKITTPESRRGTLIIIEAMP